MPARLLNQGQTTPLDMETGPSTLAYDQGPSESAHFWCLLEGHEVPRQPSYCLPTVVGGVTEQYSDTRQTLGCSITGPVHTT